MSNTKRIQLIIAVTILALLVFFLPVENWLSVLNGWSQASPNLAVLAFSFLVVLGMVLILPVSILAMAAGFIFGLTKGFMIMFIAGLAGFAAAFLLGRSLARPWVEHWVGRRSDFAAIDKAINSSGLMVVLLTRLAMILPYNLLNYCFGLTAVRLRDYLLGSALGSMPALFLFVFIGSTATDITAIMSGELELGAYDWLLGGFGLLVAVAAVALVTRLAHKALRAELENSK